MIPSIDDRLDSMARALREVVIPSLAPERSMAIEQAHLMLAHIGVIREHLDLAPSFERRELDEMIALANALHDAAAGGARTMAASDALRAALDSASSRSPGEIRLASCRIGEAIEDLIDASYDDGDDVFRAVSLDRALAAGQQAAAMNRAWNLSSGFEAADAGISPIDARWFNASGV